MGEPQWFHAELTSGQKVTVHKHELDHLRRERLIAMDGGSERVTVAEDGYPGAPVKDEPSDGGPKTDLAKDGTASKTAPKITKE
jgi:hypothetical protein